MSVKTSAKEKGCNVSGALRRSQIKRKRDNKGPSEITIYDKEGTGQKTGANKERGKKKKNGETRQKKWGCLKSGVVK